MSDDANFKKSFPSLVLPSEVEEFSRRELIQSGVTLTAFTSLWSLLGAEPVSAAITFPPKRRLVWINMSGGWDILEVTDPKQASTSGIDMSYDWGAAQELVGGDGTRIGRWCSNIASLGTDVLAVRGMAMGTTSHMAGSVYMDTGILSNAGRVNAASIPAIIASESAATIPIIQLSGGSDPMIDRGLLNSVSPVRASNLDLYRSMYPTAADQIERKKMVLDYLKSSIAGFQAMVGTNDRLTDLAAAEAKIRVQFEGDVGSKLSLTAADSESFSKCSANGRATGTTDAFALATKLISNDLVTCINLGVGGFDTHAGQTLRMQPILETTDRLVKAMVDKLRAAGKLDTTLIVMYSDFGRTPKVNGSNGRDHWPIGGALMIGGGIAGGRGVGSTDSSLLAESINTSTGAVDTTGTQLSPVHLGGSVLALTLGSGYLTYRPYLKELALLTRLK
ncbi:MAG: DUF1501 domain-containing protein [Proteobacteria bacterium]|nr:DUF1501 domain-containing protein [Pseudomonadota bacterium]